MFQKLSSTFVLLIGLLVIFQACENPVAPAPPPEFKAWIVEDDQIISYNEPIIINTEFLNADSTSYKWFVNESEQNSEIASSFNFSAIPDVDTSYKISVEINNGKTIIIDSINITVLAPRPYSIKLSAPKTTISSDESLQITAETINDKNISQGSFTWEIDGTVDNSATSSSFTLLKSTLADSNHTIKVNWTIEGSTYTDEITITVKASTKPFISIVSNSLVFAAGETNSFKIDVYNPEFLDEGSMTVKWYIDDELISRTSYYNYFVNPKLFPDIVTTYTLRAEYTIGSNVYSDEVKFTVQKTPPPVLDLNIGSNASVNTGKFLSLNISGTYKNYRVGSGYTDGTIEWYLNDVLVRSATYTYYFNEKVFIDTDFNLRVKWIVDGKTIEKTSTITVLGPPAPTINILNKGPSELSFGEDTTFEIEGQFNGEAPKTDLQWFVDDIIQTGETNTTFKFNATPLVKTDYTVKVTWNTAGGTAEDIITIPVGSEIAAPSMRGYDWVNQVNLQWESVPEAVSYNIYYKPGLFADMKFIANTIDTSFSYSPSETDDNLKYEIRSVKADGSLSLPDFTYAYSHSNTFNAEITNTYLESKADAGRFRTFSGFIQNNETRGVKNVRMLARGIDASGKIISQEEQTVATRHIAAGQRVPFQGNYEIYNKKINTVQYTYIFDSFADFVVPDCTVSDPSVRSESPYGITNYYYKYVITNNGSIGVYTSPKVVLLNRDGRIVDIINTYWKSTAETNPKTLLGETNTTHDYWIINRNEYNYAIKEFYFTPILQ